MGRRKGDTPQKAALRQLMQGYLKDNDISVKNGTDVNAIMRDMMSVILEGALDEELNEELGYSRYDYRNKDTNKQSQWSFWENHAYQLWGYGNRCSS